MRLRQAAQALTAAAALFAAGVLAAEGGNPPFATAFPDAQRLSVGNGQNLRPAWSPDGTRIAFQSTGATNGTFHIWVVNADGTGLRQVTFGEGDQRRPAWHPDGSHIAFDWTTAEGRDIWMVEVESGELTRLTSSPGEETFPSWSPDGSALAYYAYDGQAMDIWVADLREHAARRVTTNLATVRERQCTVGCHAVTWNGDGTRIAYGDGTLRQVWVARPDGTEAWALTPPADPSRYHFPTWRQDGSLLVVAEEVGEKAWSDVWRFGPDGSKRERLLTRIEHGGPFSWSPDGTRVAFHSPRSGSFQVYVAQLDKPVGALTDVGGPANLSRAAAVLNAGERWSYAALGGAALAVGLGVWLLWRQRTRRGAQ